MNFLNPFALIGLVAAGIPVLLHLLNLRKLRVVNLGTLRFLQELQQTRVRKLRLKQLLLLILRTLIVVFAVFALARPTTPSALPLLSSTSRASVVILIDNSASMEAADQRGVRFQQAKEAARDIINSLHDGDEVAVVPLTGIDPTSNAGLTRTFRVAHDAAEQMELSDNSADLPKALRQLRSMFADALHSHREVYVISDAQQSQTMRALSDTGIVLNLEANVFLVRVGSGIKSLEQNFSVDSVRLLTTLPRADTPLEVEAWIRNGSEHDIEGILTSMSFNGTRVAQRATDIPAGSTRSIVMSAPPQRSGLVAISVELENDAIDRDNVRWLGAIIPAPARIGLVGNASEIGFIRTVLSLPGMARNAPAVKTFSTVRDASSGVDDLDILVLAGSGIATSDALVVKQFVERGGGILVFADNQKGVAELMQNCGLTLEEVHEAPQDAPFTIIRTDRAHPLFTGVFVSHADQHRAIESPTIRSIRPSLGGVNIIETGGGALLTEHSLGAGRILYVAVAPQLKWSSFPSTGLFAALVVRSMTYLVAPRNQAVDIGIGEPQTVTIPSRYANSRYMAVRDVYGVVSNLQPARLPSQTVLAIPPQQKSGVVTIASSDDMPVMTVSVNGPTEESRLVYMEDNTWKTAVADMVLVPDRVVVVSANSHLDSIIRSARTGSELWSVFILLAIACAVAEMMVSRFMAHEAHSPLSA